MPPRRPVRGRAETLPAIWEQSSKQPKPVWEGFFDLGALGPQLQRCRNDLADVPHESRSGSKVFPSPAETDATFVFKSRSVATSSSDLSLSFLLRTSCGGTSPTLSCHKVGLEHTAVRWQISFSAPTATSKRPGFRGGRQLSSVAAPSMGRWPATGLNCSCGGNSPQGTPNAKAATACWKPEPTHVFGRELDCEPATEVVFAQFRSSGSALAAIWSWDTGAMSSPGLAPALPNDPTAPAESA